MTSPEVAVLVFDLKDEACGRKMAEAFHALDDVQAYYASSAGESGGHKQIKIGPVGSSPTDRKDFVVVLRHESDRSDWRDIEGDIQFGDEVLYTHDHPPAEEGWINFSVSVGRVLTREEARSILEHSYQGFGAVGYPSVLRPKDTKETLEALVLLCQGYLAVALAGNRCGVMQVSAEAAVGWKKLSDETRARLKRHVPKAWNGPKGEPHVASREWWLQPFGSVEKLEKRFQQELGDLPATVRRLVEGLKRDENGLLVSDRGPEIVFRALECLASRIR